MTDRELLELAAKAAGILDELEWFEEPYGNCWVQGSREWNPLTDDGDALRLAVKLELRIDAQAFEKRTIVTAYDYDAFFIEPHNDDPYAATRRAIVRAAAEIGRTM